MNIEKKIYIPKAELSTIQNLLYPKKKNMNFEHHKRNLKFINYLYNINKENKIKLQHFIEDEKKKEKILYKNPKYENISSKFEEHTENWVRREAKKHKKYYKNKKIKLNSLNNFVDNYNSNIYLDKNYLLDDNLYNNDINNFNSRNNNNIIQSYSSDNMLINKNSNNIYNKYLNNNYNKISSPNNIRNNILFSSNDNYNYNKEKIIIPIINKNYKSINSDNDNQLTKSFYNNNYNNNNFEDIYQYNKKYNKEMNNLLNEYNNINNVQEPFIRNASLLPEDQRINILINLIENKKNIEIMLQQMPTNNISAFYINKKAELIEKLNQIEKGINKFSRKKVFVKYINK